MIADTICDHPEGKGVYSIGLDPDLLMHEFGHILQANDIGKFNFYTKLGPQSLLSANRDGKNGWHHMSFWSETWANFKSDAYFGGFFEPEKYPIRDISIGVYRWLTMPIFFTPGK